MRRRSVRSLVPLALIAALLIVGLNTWFAVAAIRSLLSSGAWLNHTWQVIGQNDRVLADATSAESYTRGFLLSGNASLLDNFRSLQRTLPDEVESLRKLTDDNALQQANATQLRSVVSQRLAILQNVIDTRRAGGSGATQPVISSGKGAREMETLRSLSRQIGDEEHRLLIDREAEERHAGLEALFAVALACVLDLLMIAFVTFYFVEERTLRLASEDYAERLAESQVEVEQRAQEVRALNAQLEVRVQERTAELEATNRELEAFSYSVSHDLRAPLRTIDGFSLALQEDYAEAVDATGRDYIGRVRAGVQRMGQLIDALLQLSRITRAEVAREPVDVARLATAVATTLTEENKERVLNFQITGGPEANADSKLLQVALENLLGNAVKFTGKRPVADIQFGWDTEQAAWRVRDNGAGFDMHYADKLFNAFNRLHGDRDFKGSGIGLATVARVVRRHGGRIWADSTVDHGATFWFTLG